MKEKCVIFFQERSLSCSTSTFTKIRSTSGSAVTDSQDLKLLHFSAVPLHEEDLVKEAIPEGFPFLSMNLAGFDRPYERHGNKFIVTAPGYRMKYLSHSDERNEFGRLLTFHTKDEETGVTAGLLLAILR